MGLGPQAEGECGMTASLSLSICLISMYLSYTIMYLSPLSLSPFFLSLISILSPLSLSYSISTLFLYLSLSPISFSLFLFALDLITSSLSSLFSPLRASPPSSRRPIPLAAHRE